MTDVFRTGDVIEVWVEFRKSSDDSYIDPTSCKISAWVNGAQIVDDQDLTKSATGKYYYALPVGDSEGVLTVQIKSVSGDFVTYTEEKAIIRKKVGDS